MVNGVTSWLTNVYTKGSEILQKLIDGIRGSFANLTGIGKDIIDGLWQGIVNNWQTLVNNIRDRFSNLFSGIRDLLGIRSPSKLFATGIGRPLAEGIMTGFVGEMDEVERTMRMTIAGLMRRWKPGGGQG